MITCICCCTAAFASEPAASSSAHLTLLLHLLHLLLHLLDLRVLLSHFTRLEVNVLIDAPVTPATGLCPGGIAE